MVEDRIETFKPVFDSVFAVDDYLYFYSDILTLESTEVQMDFLHRELALDNTAEVLDLACGYGRHSNLLVALGCNVSGIDSSSEFLEIAKSDAIAKGVKVNYMQQDMRELALIERFDCILMLFTSFGLAVDNDNETVISRLQRQAFATA